MSVTEEEGGRLNAFAKEPKIEVIDSKASSSQKNLLIILTGILILIVLIGLSIYIS